MQGHSAMDIRKQCISINGYPCFMDITLQLSMLLWISIWISLDFYGYPCIDLVWILDPGKPLFFCFLTALLGGGLIFFRSEMMRMMI